jgi:pseudaminic acid biosynthesis-associated methylase
MRRNPIWPESTDTSFEHPSGERMTKPITPQEALWRGDFGDAYVDRNAAAPDKLAALTRHWARVLRMTEGAPPARILEVGANIGLNLRALARLTTAELHAVEPNARARDILVRDAVVPAGRVTDALASATGLEAGSFDLTFTSGVLIHIHPRDLLASCHEIHRLSRRYVACIEYFSDSEQEVPYRGHGEVLFKRDFGGFYLDNFPDLRLLDYGFAWKRTTGLDNLTWWLFEKG